MGRKSREWHIRSVWGRLKVTVKVCPNPKCHSRQTHICVIPKRTFKRYWLECWNCHWCGRRANTIRGAIRQWNRDDGK